MIRDNNRICKRMIFDEGPVMMVDHKPEALESDQKPIAMNTFLLGLIGK